MQRSLIPTTLQVVRSSCWNYNFTGGSPAIPEIEIFEDMDVKTINTGATAVQASPHLAPLAR
jgi:hypothetical protein